MKLARGAANKTVEQIKTEAAAEVTAWQGATDQSPDGVATEIYTPLKKRAVSKAQVAEQLAKLIEDLPDNPATFRTKIPTYLTRCHRSRDRRDCREPRGRQHSPAELPATAPGGSEQ